jgi:hypothetical protein
MRYAFSLQSAAQIAWDLSEKFGLNLPNESWNITIWSSGQYETTPVTYDMLRGFGLKFDKREDFIVMLFANSTSGNGRLQTCEVGVVSSSSCKQ